MVETGRTTENLEEQKCLKELRKLIRGGSTREEIYELLNAYSFWCDLDEVGKNTLYETNYEEYSEKKEELIAKINKKYDIGSLSYNILHKLAAGQRNEATEEIVKEILRREHIYTTKDDNNPEMWSYTEGICTPQAKTLVKELCREVLQEAYTTHLCNEVINKIQADTFIGQDAFFANNSVAEVVVQNGILNIFTRELTPFTPDKIFFNKLPIKYDLEKDCPSIRSHFLTVLKNESDVPLIEEVFGFLLLKEYKIEKALMLIGSGRNGKSKTMELMKRFIGVENCSNIPLHQFETDIFACGELLNKMANLSGEVDERTLKNTGIFKQLTGRDLISASRKFLSRVNFINYAKLIFATNQLPRTDDLSIAFFSRWILLEFPYKFVPENDYNNMPEEDRKMIKIMDMDIVAKLTTEEELSGLLNLALGGLERLLKNRDFSHSKSNEDTKIMWIRKSDSFAAFMMDCVAEEPECKITKKDLRQAYNDYCKKYKLKPMNDKHIKYLLSTNHGVQEGRETQGESQVYYWWGIKFNVQNSQGSEACYGFSSYRQISNSPKTINTIATLTTLASSNPLLQLLDCLKTTLSGLSLEELRDSCLQNGLNDVQFSSAFEEAKMKGLIQCPRGEGKDKPVMVVER